MSKEAMKLALEALKTCSGVPHWPTLQPVIKALEEALAKQEQGEPVAWMNHHGGVSLRLFTGLEENSYTIPLYTTPQQRKPLTDEEIEKCYETTGHYQTLRTQDRFAVFALARAIEAAHGIKE